MAPAGPWKLQLHLLVKQLTTSPGTETHKCQSLDTIFTCGKLPPYSINTLSNRGNKAYVYVYVTRNGVSLTRNCMPMVNEIQTVAHILD